MYRESLFGVALASTLAELEPMCCLSEGQKEQLWDIFDIAMDRTLEKAPVLSRVRIISPHPRLAEEPPASVVLSRPPISFPAPKPSTAEDLVQCDVLDENICFPVYRLHDSIWTIILKNPSVEVKDGLGHAETIQLDYLKVILKDVSATEAKSGVRKRRR